MRWGQDGGRLRGWTVCPASLLQLSLEMLHKQLATGVGFGAIVLVDDERVDTERRIGRLAFKPDSCAVHVST